MKVLVVDDERELGDLLAQYLKRRGHECLAVGGLEEARRACAGFAPDAVVLDQFMADGNGMSLISFFKSQPKPAWVIMVTGAGGGEAEMLADLAGADRFLPKPVDLKALLACLEEKPAHD